MGFDPGHDGSQKRRRGLGIGMIGKALKKGVDIPFGQRLVPPRQMEFNETDQGQIAGIRARKGIQDLVERGFVHRVQDEALNVIQEIPSRVRSRLFGMNQGGANRPQGLSVRLVCQAQAIHGLGAYRGVRRQVQDPGQDWNGLGGPLRFGIEGAQPQPGGVDQRRARIFFQELFEGDDGLAGLTLGFQGNGMQKGEFLDKCGRVGSIEKRFNQPQRRVALFPPDLNPDSGKRLLLGELTGRLLRR